MSYRVNNLLYAAGPDLVNAIRLEITLTEPVDVPALREALGKAALRFPYYAVKLVQCASEYRMEANELPFVLSPEGRTVTLGTRESNYHLFAFAWDGCRLYIDTVHFITDGNGLFPFLKTILYYYLHLLHPEYPFDTEEICLAGTSVPHGEGDDDPYPEEPLPEQPLGSLSRPEEVFRLPGQPQGYENAEGWTSFRYRIRQRDMMSFVSSVDGSPATFIASMAVQAITAQHPENRLPLVCGMQHQFRKALGRPLSHLCHVNIVPIVYPERLWKKDIQQLNTMARGTLILRADDANDILTVNAHIRNEKRIREMTLPQKREYMYRVILDGIGRNTFEVSYTGRVSWSGLDRYILDVAPYLDLTLSGGISIEIFSVNELFGINLMQRSCDPVYAARFAALLTENGIPYVSDPPAHFSLCGFRLPDRREAPGKAADPADKRKGEQI